MRYSGKFDISLGDNEEGIQYISSPSFKERLVVMEEKTFKKIIEDYNIKFEDGKTI